MRQGGVRIGFFFGVQCMDDAYFLASVFLLLLARIISTFTVFEDLTLIFRLSFAYCSRTPLQGRGQ